MPTRNELRWIGGFVALGLAGSVNAISAPQPIVDNRAEEAQCYTGAVSRLIADHNEVAGDMSLNRPQRTEGHNAVNARYYAARAACDQWFAAKQG